MLCSFPFHMRCEKKVRYVKSDARMICVDELCRLIRKELSVYRDVLEIWKDGRIMDDKEYVELGRNVEIRHRPPPATMAIFKGCDPPLSYKERSRRLEEMNQETIFVDNRPPSVESRSIPMHDCSWEANKRHCFKR
jgi:hypothetical protein